VETLFWWGLVVEVRLQQTPYFPLHICSKTHLIDPNLLTPNVPASILLRHPGGKQFVLNVLSYLLMIKCGER
jgi:hypothetical protein